MATWFVDFDDVSDWTDYFTSRRSTAHTVELVTDDGQTTLHVLHGTSDTSFKPCFFSFDDAGSSVGDFEIACLIKPVHSSYNTKTTTFSHNAIAGRWDSSANRSIAYNLAIPETSGSSGANIKKDRNLTSNANGSTTWNNPEVSGVDHLDYLWMRLRAVDSGSNVNVYNKLWQADESEPASWTRSYEGTLSEINAYNNTTGYMGFGGRGNTAEYYIKKIGFASAGDTAPTSAAATTTQYSVSSGEISLGGVQTFFADSGSLALGDLYRGGGIVPDITENSSVPASGEISLSDMYGVYKNT